MADVLPVDELRRWVVSLTQAAELLASIDMAAFEFETAPGELRLTGDPEAWDLVLEKMRITSMLFDGPSGRSLRRSVAQRAPDLLERFDDSMHAASGKIRELRGFLSWMLGDDDWKILGFDFDTPTPLPTGAPSKSIVLEI
jgi:hypothetical protein